MKDELHRLFADHLWTPNTPLLDVTRLQAPA